MDLRNNFVHQKDLRELLSQKLLSIFTSEGFKFNKNAFIFRKNTQETKIEISFRFISNYPDYQSYSFTCNILYKKLNNIIDEFLAYSKRRKDFTWNLIIPEGEFISELKNDQFKQKLHYFNEVDTMKYANIVTDQTTLIIKEWTIPFIKVVNSLDGFQHYFMQPEKVLDRVLEHEFILTCLFAAYEISYNIFKEVYLFIKNEYEVRTSERLDLSYRYEMIKNINDFVEYKEKLDQ